MEKWEFILRLLIDLLENIEALLPSFAGSMLQNLKNPAFLKSRVFAVGNHGIARLNDLQTPKWGGHGAPPLQVFKQFAMQQNFS